MKTVLSFTSLKITTNELEKRYYIVLIKVAEGQVYSYFTEMNPYEYYFKRKTESAKILEFVDFHEVTKEYVEWLEIKQKREDGITN